MVYGYVNRFNGETEEFLTDRNVEKIIYCDCENHDLSFLEKGDTIILFELKSISNDLKQALEFTQYVFDNEIEVHCADKINEMYDDFIDTSKAMGKFIIGIWACLNRLDDELYRK